MICQTWKNSAHPKLHVRKNYERSGKMEYVSYNNLTTLFSWFMIMFGLKRIATVITTAFLLLGASVSHSTPITSSDAPLLSGATRIDFSEVPIGTLDPVIGGVEFMGDGNPVEVVFNDFFGNQDPPQLSNQTFSIDGISFDILFGFHVGAFGFEAAGVNSETILEAYDALDNLLGTISYPTDDRFGVHFRGLGALASSITRIHVNTDDFIFFDSLYFTRDSVSVPVPASLWLLLCGLVAIRVSRRTPG